MNQYNDKGQRHGEWEQRLVYNIVHKGSYVNGKEHGYFESFHVNGAIKSWTGYYDMGNAIGFWQHFDNNEKLFEITFTL